MSSKPSVLLTEHVFSEVEDLLKQHTSLTVGKRGQYNSESTLMEAIPEFDGLLSMLSNPVTSRVIKHGKRLRVVANYAVGYNNIDTDACREAGVRVANTPGILTDATADGTLALMLSTVRRIPAAQDFLHSGRFDGWHPSGFLGMELRGRTLGIIGMGRIGQAVAIRCKAFGMRIIYHNRGPLATGDIDPGLKDTEYVSSPAEIAERSNIISLHCPLTEKTHHLVDEAFLKHMKSTAWLINTSRGPVIDESALARALHSGEIAGAGLDVFEKEPEVHPLLLTAPNTVLIPHITSATLDTRLEMGMRAAGAILNELCGMDHSCNFVV